MHKTISYPPPLKYLLPVIYFPDGKKRDDMVNWKGQEKKNHNLDFKRKKTYRLLNPLIFKEKKYLEKKDRTIKSDCIFFK